MTEQALKAVCPNEVAQLQAKGFNWQQILAIVQAILAGLVGNLPANVGATSVPGPTTPGKKP